MLAPILSAMSTSYLFKLYKTKYRTLKGISGEAGTHRSEVGYSHLTALNHSRTINTPHFSPAPRRLIGRACCLKVFSHEQDYTAKPFPCKRPPLRNLAPIGASSANPSLSPPFKHKEPIGRQRRYFLIFN